MGSYNLSKLNFMIVDANSQNAQQLEKMLQTFGINRIASVRDGKTAVREMESFSANILIVDWDIVHPDCVSFIRQMRDMDTSPNPYIPIILLTGIGHLERLGDVKNAGVHEFLAKPVSQTGLYSRIRSIVEHPRQFVKAPNYFGPDRRRRTDGEYSGPERRLNMSRFSSLTNM